MDFGTIILIFESMWTGLVCRCVWQGRWISCNFISIQLGLLTETDIPMLENDWQKPLRLFDGQNYVFFTGKVLQLSFIYLMRTWFVCGERMNLYEDTSLIQLVTSNVKSRFFPSSHSFLPFTCIKLNKHFVYLPIDIELIDICQLKLQNNKLLPLTFLFLFYIRWW